jgi:hypothetical protein
VTSGRSHVPIHGPAAGDTGSTGPFPYNPARKLAATCTIGSNSVPVHFLVSGALFAHEGQGMSLNNTSVRYFAHFRATRSLLVSIHVLQELAMHLILLSKITNVLFAADV